MIGIFDSGTGGLAAARTIADCLPGYGIIYFGDTARTPYGTKSPEAIARYVIEGLDFLVSRGAKLIVVSCDSASSVVSSSVRDRYDVPVLDTITAGAEYCLERSGGRRVGILTSRATGLSGVFERRIKQLDSRRKVFCTPCPLLVPLIEEGWENKMETIRILKTYLHPLKAVQVDTLILACSHSIPLQSVIQRKMGKRVKIVDSSVAVAAHVCHYLDTHSELNQLLDKASQLAVYVSDITDQVKSVANQFFKHDIPLERVDLTVPVSPLSSDF
ncbi:MAG: glutamate racemase [Desulfobacterales bacterium]|nr:glutamate racemase [Desulfobacterales bacterium]MDD4391646.1 glutamate racemase [Desulfobacterales bacterium]